MIFGMKYHDFHDFLWDAMKIWIHEDSRKPEFFFYSLQETLTIIYHSIENFMGYKMILNSKDRYTVLKNSSVSQFSKTVKALIFGTMSECYVVILWN